MLAVAAAAGWEFLFAAGAQGHQWQRDQRKAEGDQQQDRLKTPHCLILYDLPQAARLLESGDTLELA